ncbi:unnamed protein product [Phytophthora fragariaefolia]|uniref:Unnamed protein product n=1 Tax=Phytophthora fragariaefolia TaxID=1490495 RepID=A0A9W6U303_9STRA|nr:unnamed protein product [Phytophthora fragariaefolia]
MYAHARFVTVYPVQTKHQDEINGLIHRYLAWAERQWSTNKIAEVYSDGGGEFENRNIKNWYQARGIIHTVTLKKMSRLNMVERTHQTLGVNDERHDESLWLSHIVLGGRIALYRVPKEPIVLQ